MDSCGIAQAHRAPALGTERIAASAIAGLSAWVRQAGFELPEIEKGPHAHLPQIYSLTSSKEKDDLAIVVLSFSWAILAWKAT